MSAEYNDYLIEHINNVREAYAWLCSRFPNIQRNILGHEDIFAVHDASKYSPEEYDAYDKYFYGGNRSFGVVNEFNKAWLHHIHQNPHHWQHWVLIHDDEPEETLDMPYWYIIEMICDWWSFSFKNGNLFEIFDWYEKHKSMKLSDNTRKTVENILGRIKVELEKE